MKHSRFKFPLLLSCLLITAAVRGQSAADTLKVPPPATKTLKEVVIKNEVKTVDKQADKTTFNIENSINSAGASAMEIVEKLPGVQVNPDGQMLMNGKPGVRVYIDGKAVQLAPEDLSNLLRGIPAAGIQKIEVRSNPSAQYDAAGNAGIINIIRKKNNKENLNGSVTGAYSQGRYPKFNGSISLNLKRKWYNIYLNYAYVYREIFVDANLKSSFFSRDNQLKIAYNANNYHRRYYNTHTPSIGADLNLSNKTTLSVIASRGIQYFDNQTGAQSDIFNSSYDKTNSYDFSNRLNDGLYNYAVSTRLMHRLDSTGGILSADLDYANYSTTSGQQITNITRDAAGKPLNTDRITLDQGRDLNIYSAKVDLSKRLPWKIRLDAGVKSTYVRSENDSRTYYLIAGNKVSDSAGSNHFIYTENINAAYVSLGRNFRKLSVQLGLRGEHTTSSGKLLLHNIPPVKLDYFNLFPSVTLDYKAGEKHTLSLKSGRRINRPPYEDMNALRRYINPTSYFEGNPLLRPEISYKHEVTYAYNNALFVTLGYQHMRDYVIRWVFPVNNDSAGLRKPMNITRAAYLNLDVAYSGKLSSWWTTSSTFTVYKPSFRGNINGYGLPDENRLSFNFSSNNTFTITGKLSAELTYKYLYENQDGATISASKSALDIGIKRSLFHNNGAVSVTMSDVFWTDINRYSVRSGSVQDVMDVRFDTRVLRISLHYGFGNASIKKRRTGTAADEEKKRAGGS